MLQAFQKFTDAGLACLPTNSDKNPAIPKGSSWKGGRTDPKEFIKAHGIAILCGATNRNIEALDFDNHFGDARKRLKEFCQFEEVREILEKYPFPLEETVNKGYHLIYRCDQIGGNEKLACRIDSNGRPDALIETRGEGGYFCCDPTPGYRVIKNDLLNIPTISIEEREILISAARSFNEVIRDIPKISEEEGGRPGDIYNKSPESLYEMKQALLSAGWKELKDGIWQRPWKTRGTSATLGKAHPGIFYNFSANGYPFDNQKGYTAFQVVGLLNYGGDFKRFAKELREKQSPPAPKKTIEPDPDSQFIRVGTTYYKIIRKTDRYGITRKELKTWNRETIVLDYGKKYLDTIPKYDDFVMVPDNLNYKPYLNNCFNLYSEFKHKPQEGDWKWSKIMLQHVFGSQYELGLRYMQTLFMYPDRQTVILCLVSSKKQTGKTTFLNWLNMLYGDNMCLLSSQDFLSNFNFYGRKNIIAVEETLFEKKLTMEKLKALATQKYITVNEKFVNPYMIPFYGKIILTSNYEDRFALIDREEIRFFVRKLDDPVHKNFAIEKDLLHEIPAFLHYLKSLPPIDWDNAPSRSGFSAEELRNEFLTAVMDESRHETTKELILTLTEYFDNHEGLTEFYANPSDLKKEFFQYDNHVGKAWLMRVLKDDLNMQPEKLQRYSPFNRLAESKTGTPYRFERKDFCLKV